jgi:hypothetical protein
VAKPRRTGKSGLRRAAVIAAVAVGVVFAIAGAAFADTIFVDGDTVANPPNINIGGSGNRPCSDLGSLIAGTATVSYTGSAHFQAGETVDAVVTPDAAATAAGITVTPATGTVPSPWDGSSADFSVGFSTSLPADTSDGTYHVEVGAKGRSSGYDPNGRPQFIINVACGNTGGGGGGGSTDTTPPAIGYTLNPASPDGANGWYKSDVTLTWTVTENESPSSLLKTGCVDQNITSDQLATTYSCSATSDGGSAGPVNVTLKRDATAPSLNISGAADEAKFDLCSGAPSSPSFSPFDATSGLDGSEGDSWTSSLQPSGVGSYTYTAHAQDNAGNPSSETRNYSVVYGGAFSGYLQPINSDGSSRFKLGSTIPVKFKLLCGTTPISTAVAKMYVVQGDSRPDPGVDEGISTAASTTGNLFRYDTTAQQYIFNLSTKLGYTNPGSSAPVSFSQGTWTLKIGLDDGTYKSINIQLVK